MPSMTHAERLAAEGDLREFIRAAERMGQLVVVEGVDPHLEMGALYELSLEHLHPPVLLFDNIKGYPAGRRVVMNVRNSRVFNEFDGLEEVQAYRKRRRDAGSNASIPPIEVETGPVCQNILTGAHVNVLAFPAPKWHEQDGGQYIGTECMVITRDPDSDWVNAGTYRAQVQDETSITVFIEPGKHGYVIRQRYWDRGEPCPMLLCVGQAPILGRLAGSGSKHGESEFASAGGRLGRPIQVVRGRLTGLPFPADAELVFEGFMHPRSIDQRPEGPFG
ncbi:MAG: UbiD family decarboxylase, partial [Chloroflexi bacterium]|nr:UbiD family decarboxylase [Chloroflexota bacterium]